MFTEMVISFTCALSTIGLRALINVADRHIFTRENSDFIKSMTMNALFPFLIALCLGFTQNAFEEGFISWILNPGVILSALAAQISGYGFSFAFKRMPIRNVVISSKLADLFLPFCVWAISHRFSMQEYIFSIATILAFTPIMWDVIKSKSDFYKRLAILLIFIVLFQTSMNEYLHLRPITDTWPSFLAFMTAVLFWRSIYTLLPLIGRWFIKDDKPKQKTYYHLLLLRSAIAYLSQALFFVAIIHGSPNLTWPVLSAGPLLSTFAGYLFLKEKMGKPELTSLCMFMCVVVVYALINWLHA